MAGALYRAPHSACTNRLPCSNCCAVHVLLSSRVPMHCQPRRPPPVAACPTQAPPAAAARRSPACGPAPSECGWRSGPSLQGPGTRRGACGPGQELAQHGRVLETARTAWCTAAPHPRGPPAPERAWPWRRRTLGRRAKAAGGCGETKRELAGAEGCSSPAGSAGAVPPVPDTGSGRSSPGN